MLLTQIQGYLLVFACNRGQQRATPVCGEFLAQAKEARKRELPLSVNGLIEVVQR